MNLIAIPFRCIDPAVCLAALLLLLLLCLSGCTPRTPGEPWPDRAGIETRSPAPAVHAFTPAATPSPVFTPTPMSSLTVSGDYDNPAVHADGRYALQLAGPRVTATFATARSPVEDWVRRIVPQPLFTIPEPFRPPHPVLRTVEGRSVLADGTPDPARTALHRFLLRVDPDGSVHYVDDGRVEDAGHLAYELHTVWDTTPPPPAAPTFTPTPMPTFTPTPTFVPAVPSPTPSLTVSGTYDNPVEHADGRYDLQLAGARVAATFAASRSPVAYWAREVSAPLFTVPEPFRPPYPVLRTAVGTPVRADGAPDHPEPRRFLLRVDPDGGVHYVDDARVEGEGQQAYCLNLVGLTGVGVATGSLRPPAGIAGGTLRAPAAVGAPPPPSRCAAAPEHTGRFLAYSLHTTWGTTPAANDRAVLEILDRHWFGETLLSAVPPPVQFEVPEHRVHRRGTFPAARVGAFVTFDADGRVTALGAPTNEPKASAGAPVYDFHAPLLPELGQLHHLEHLDLGYTSERDAKYRDLGWGPEALTGAIPPQLWRLPRLRHLDLQGQLLAWTLPSDIGRLASLEYLDLGNNWLSGPLPPELGRLASLKHLDLGGNDFTEPLPPELGRLASLEQLDLSHSQLIGPLPSELGRLTSLRRLDLTDNRLSSSSLPSELGNLVKLEYLELSGNQLTDLPPALGQLVNLKWLNLHNNQLTSLPPELGRLVNLELLDLRRNRLTALPPTLGQLASLKRLELGYNGLTALPSEWGQLANLRQLDLSHNQLTGSLPTTWGQLTNLEYLNLGDHHLTGPLPPEWGQLTSLQRLYLADNQLTGPLPPEWSQLANLQELDLHGNQLTGPLPPEWSQLANLQELDLHGNQLTGPLPPAWGELDNLESLSLGSNQLTGPLPPKWGQLANLWWLSLFGNQLTGSLPPEWGQLASLWWLDLSDNQLTGPPPPEWDRIVNLEFLHLEDNQLTGCVPAFAYPYDAYIAHDLPSCAPPAGQE